MSSEAFCLELEKYFLEKGISDGSFKEFSEQKNISRTSLNYYFKNKQDLLLNLLRQINTNIRLALQNDLANIEDPVDKLSVFILRACNLIIEEKNYFYVLLDFWTQLNHNERMRKAIQKLYQSYRKVCSDILNEGIIKGKIKQIDVIYTATMIVSMVQGLIIQYVIEPEAFDYSYYVNKIKNQIIETIISKGVNNGI